MAEGPARGLRELGSALAGCPEMLWTAELADSDLEYVCLGHMIQVPSFLSLRKPLAKSFLFTNLLYR